jgi:hypothetical protein
VSPSHLGVNPKPLVGPIREAFDRHTRGVWAAGLVQFASLPKARPQKLWDVGQSNWRAELKETGQGTTQFIDLLLDERR